MTKKYQVNHAKEHKKQAHCSICNRYRKYSERYPDLVCDKCVALATDKQGQPVSFFNITEGGHGIQGTYTQTGKLYRSTVCYIKQVRCNAEEAYLGGIIIRPFQRNRKSKASDLSDDPETL